MTKQPCRYSGHNTDERRAAIARPDGKSYWINFPDDEPDDVNVFVDVEFEVVSLDRENNKIVAMPYSLRRKNITTPLDPRDVLEISFKRNRSKGGA